jgi:hypothetical protein
MSSKRTRSNLAPADGAHPRRSEETRARTTAEQVDAAIAALSAASGDALSKAAAEGFPERDDVVAWGERMLRVVL